MRTCKQKMKERHEKKTVGCGVSHRSKVVDCATRVVYGLPFSCDAIYIGQTGRCVNLRLSKPEANCSTNALPHVVAHCKECGCVSQYEKTSIINRSNDQTTLEIIEALHNL